MPISPAVMDNARAQLAQAQKKLDRLTSIDPYFIDLSLRENPFGSRIGQTLQDKIAILPLVREFGFKNVLVGTLDYALPDELEVDDDFMMWLRDNQQSMDGCFAFTDIGFAETERICIPSPSMRKLQAYQVPNTLHEIYLSKRNQTLPLQILKQNIAGSVRWLQENVSGDGGGAPRIIMNVVDGMDAFADNLDYTCDVLSMLAELNIEGVSFEDDRGTFLPFQVGTYVSIARSILPATHKILVHMHSGGGFENASVIEAIVNGADGVWGALPKRAAIIGHASLGELIANLVRVGNPNMQQYQLSNLLPLATKLQFTDDQEALPEDLPILGANAYRTTLDFFRQLPDRFMDLVPTAIGGTQGWRVCPLASDPPVLAGRLAEITGQPPQSFPVARLEMMVRLMRRDLRQGTQIVYDDPEQLLALYQRAGG